MSYNHTRASPLHPLLWLAVSCTRTRLPVHIYQSGLACGIACQYASSYSRGLSETALLVSPFRRLFRANLQRKEITSDNQNAVWQLTNLQRASREPSVCCGVQSMDGGDIMTLRKICDEQARTSTGIHHSNDPWRESSYIFCSTAVAANLTTRQASSGRWCMYSCV